MLFLAPAGFQPIASLASLEGLLNSLAPASKPQLEDENAFAHAQTPKTQCVVQHRGTLGFLQAFLKLQQAMEKVSGAQDQSQVFA